jgi:hypothetical protein
LQVEPPPLDSAHLRIMQETAQMAAQIAVQQIAVQQMAVQQMAVQQMVAQQAAVQQAAVQQAAVQQAAVEVRNTHTDTRACKSCI